MTRQPWLDPSTLGAECHVLTTWAITIMNKVNILNYQVVLNVTYFLFLDINLCCTVLCDYYLGKWFRSLTPNVLYQAQSCFHTIRKSLSFLFIDFNPHNFLFNCMHTKVVQNNNLYEIYINGSDRNFNWEVFSELY